MEIAGSHGVSAMRSESWTAAAPIVASARADMTTSKGRFMRGESFSEATNLFQNVERAKEALRCQFVQWMFDEQGLVLAQLERADKCDGNCDHQMPALLQWRRQTNECAERKKTERDVPHINKTKIHPVFHVA